jgi:hypothetical protein
MAFAYFTGLEPATWPAMAARVWPGRADGPDPAELARLADDGCPHAAVRRARVVCFYVERAGFLPITKRWARTLIDRLGSRLLVRTTRDGDCAGLEVCPF